MDLKIRLTPEAEMDLAREARRQGLPPEEAAARLLQERLTQGRREAARSLLREWQQEASAPAETGQTQAEWEALKSALDEDRLSHRKLFAEEA